MDVADRVARRYEQVDEDQRLWLPDGGDLVRLRTWDIFDRYLPAGQRIVDIGGGPAPTLPILPATVTMSR